MAALSVATEEAVSLRQWIKGAVGRNNNGIADEACSAYMAASLKIAISVAEQISRAEKSAERGVYEALNWLPNRALIDWASCVRIRVKVKVRDSLGARQNVAAKSYELLDLQPLPFAPGINDSISAAGWDDDCDAHMNEQLRAFLASFDADKFEESTAAASSQHGRDLSELALTVADKISHFGNACSSELDYLTVDSAEVWRPDSGPRGIFNCNGITAKDKGHRMYSLALVFYELFSRGKKPPPSLISLSISDVAFISLPLEDDRDGEVYTSETKRRQSPASRGSERETRVCQRSFEYLRSIGLPGPICSLIFNMLDCIHGDLSGDECYKKIDDVVSDLKLMMNKPSKFLLDLDFEKLSLSGLPLNESLFYRQQEFESIQSCYRRSVSGFCEPAIISGESGTGKSWLAQRIGNFIVAQGGIFLSGKFDQMKQAKPFSALASAFDNVCDMLIRENESHWVKLVVCNLQDALGSDACHLIRIIPKLSQILTHNSRIADSTSDQHCLNALQRLCYLICQFVDVISAFSIVSLTLFMDDVQWADEASMLVLCQLLIKRYRKFFVLVCCREDEMRDEELLFWKMVKNVSALGINNTTVQLSCMDVNTLYEVVSDLLCLPPRLVRSLSVIVHKRTKGNPLFFSQLMVSLNRDGLLQLSLSRRRWVWDEEAIQSIKLPHNVALCFTKGISKLPLEVQSALCTLSMFGASTKCLYIEALESLLDLKLIEPLDVAAAEGLVIRMKGSFHFYHDRIQEACYALTEKRERDNNHLMFGLCLVNLSIDTGDVDMLFTAVNQINLGGPSAVMDKDKLAIIAKYNLMAGKKATEMLDYTSAYDFFYHGISFLPNNHWAYHYQLSLELFELASQSALATGNSRSIENFFGEVLKHGRCFEDKLNINFIIVSSLSNASKVLEAFEKGRIILSRLGEDILCDPSKETLNRHIQQTQSLISGVSEHELLNYRLMTDTNKLQAMKFLAKMQHITAMAKPTLNPFVTLKMVELTILHGLSPASPIGFAFFGSLLAKLDNIRLGHAFMMLAKRLLYRLDAKDIAGEVIGVGIEVQCFVEPMLAANERRTEGESVAMKAGDIHSACLNRALYCLTLLWAGVNLSVVHETMSTACRFINEQGHKSSLFITQTGQMTALTLMGNEAMSLTHDEPSSSAQENNNTHHLMVLSFHNLYRSFMLNNDSAVKEYAEEFFQFDKSAWFMISGSIVQTFIAGLTAFQLYRESHNAIWAERGSSRKATMKLWAEQGSSWNFKQKFLLMEAEEHYCNGDIEIARKFYTSAIEAAKLHKFINDEALACELAAKFYWQIGDVMSSMEHFRLAHQKYIHWGALAKAKRLFEHTKEKFDFLIGDHTARIPINSDILALENNDEIDQYNGRTE